MQAFIALPACISSPLSLYLDPLPAALGFLQQAVATGPIWPGPRRCSVQLGYMRVGPNLPSCSYLWCRPSFSWSLAAAPLWSVQTTTPAGAAQLPRMPHCSRQHLIPPPLLPGRGLEVLLKDELIQQGEDLLLFFAKISF